MPLLPSLLLHAAAMPLLPSLLLHAAALASPCSHYDQVHSGCAPPVGPPTYCGTATKLYGGATALPNGTVVNGKRFHWEVTLVSKMLISMGDPVVTCARVCAQEPACVGFALEVSSSVSQHTCFTVNSTEYTLTRLSDCPSYSYTHDPACKPDCGSGSDALRLAAMPITSVLYQPRPSVSATAGGVRECAALCDRLPGCVGFSVSNTTEGLCFPTNTTSNSVTSFAPILSFVRATQHRPTATSSGESCLATLRAVCPAVSLSPASCRVCTGRNQYQERTAGCTADDVARYCAAGLDWWVASPTDHVFEQDLPTMSQFCGQPDGSSTRRSIQWSAVAGGTVAIQLALRWSSTEAGASATVAFEMSDLNPSSADGGGATRAALPASSISVRQLASVFAPTTQYPGEAGATYYPDILAPIHQATGSQHGSAQSTSSMFEFLYFGKQNNTNGRRLSWESGGRQITNQRVAGGGGSAGVQQCQEICESQVQRAYR
jgi:hypothetical protein